VVDVPYGCCNQPVIRTNRGRKCVAVRSTRIILVHRIHCDFISLYVAGFDAELLQMETHFFPTKLHYRQSLSHRFYEPILNISLCDVSDRI
jgi:hypothetical protein